MSKTRSSLLTTLALALPLAASSLAQANVRSTVPGGQCQPGYTVATPAMTTNNYQYDHDGSVWAVDADPSTIYDFSCPMQRALPLSTAGMSDVEVRFRAAYTFETGANRLATCTVMSLRSDGSVLAFTEKTVSVPPGTYNATTQTFSAPVVTMDFADAIDVSSSKGTYHLQCYMGSGITLLSYYHSENDGVSNN